ncbi:transposase [Faecalibacterium prausnitzii]|uniref:transposase n=2 Tax=Oscillospiraceae TaxID=216572 RepID=UPI00241CB420|nr:transposase [Faecalibacterium prausnitzii]
MWTRKVYHIRAGIANLKYKYGRRVFWAKGYYVNTVGGNETKIRKYIQEQEFNDQMCDQLSFKEY